MYSSLSIWTRGFKHHTIPKWFHSFPPRPHTILSEKSADPDLSYWYRPHRSRTKLPVLFLHGIGVRYCIVVSSVQELKSYCTDRHMALSPFLLRPNHPRPRSRHPNNRVSSCQHAYDISSSRPPLQLSRHFPHSRLSPNFTLYPRRSLLWHSPNNSHAARSLPRSSNIFDALH